MTQIGEVILSLVVLASVGILLSLPMLFPPLRRLGQYSRVTRGISIFIFGMLAFLITYVGLTRLGVETTYVFGVVYQYDKDLQADFSKNRSAIIHELWLRELRPSLVSRPCYTANPHVCELADRLYRPSQLGDWWIVLVICLVPAFTSSGCVWLFTRQKRQT